MKINKIKVTNFKSFKELEVKLDTFNILIGANASGKSNFVQIFEFLRDIENFGLDNAVSMQGGVEYLRNINIGTSDNFSLKLVADDIAKQPNFILKETDKKYLWGMEIYETTVEFMLEFRKRGPGFKIVKDKLSQKCNFYKFEKHQKKIEEKEKIGQGEIILSNVNEKINVDFYNPKNLPININDIYPPFLKDIKLPQNVLIFKSPYIFMSRILPILTDISIYDFDPKLPKKATPITGKIELEEDGSNLSIVLKNIMENKEKRRKLLNLVKDLLPFIGNLGVEKFADKSLLFKLQETYFKNHYLPASSISDGTINITALIAALYFEKKPITIIEEPERNIHPHLISKILHMIKDASTQKQIIVTTHNPEILKNADLKDILLVSRGKDGFSTISRPVDKNEIKTFLKNEIGIEELFVQGLLEV